MMKKKHKSGLKNKLKLNKKDEWVIRPKEELEINESFRQYYKSQRIIEDDEEFEEFLSILKMELPAVFRINGRGPFANHIRTKFETDLIKNIYQKGIIKLLEWYPDNLAWQLDYSKRELRKDENLKEIHEFIKLETEVGTISRQEAVSMIPVLLLDIDPKHQVLDTCAAPGSKTFQILEILHGNQKELPDGFVIANELEYVRSNLLCHQLKRMHSANIVTVVDDFRFFKDGSKYTPDRTPLFSFDRILCDVPCSGDGTIRKSPDIMQKWRVNEGSGLHALQLHITLRAVGLLKVNGLMVYSTCSLNPIEDEAVVAEVLRKSNGTMELIDISDQLPKLKRMHGLSTWKVIGKNNKKEYLDFAEYNEKDNEIKILPSFFPPDEKEKFNLERCIRILPHQNNTGGFFVALLKKVSKFEFMDNSKEEDSTTESSSQPLKKPKLEENSTVTESIDKMTTPCNNDGNLIKKIHKGHDPIITLEEYPIIKIIMDVFGINKDISKNLITRNVNSDSGAPKKIYFISDSLRKLIDRNLESATRINTIGQKVFERHNNIDYYPESSVYRISQDGLCIILPLITKQKIYLNALDMDFFLKETKIRLPPNWRNNSNNNQDALENINLHKGFVVCKSEYILNQLRNCEFGGIVVLLFDNDAARLGFPLSKDAKPGLTAHAPVAVSGWLTENAVNLMLSKPENKGLQQKIAERLAILKNVVKDEED